MPEIVEVRFASNPKTYYFDTNGLNFEAGESVIVETVRGLEYGRVVVPNKIVDESEIKGQLKPVIRKATTSDDAQAAENIRMKAGAMELCNKKIAKHGLKMKLVDAEYTFDRSKIVFSFTAEGRIDFRELVKDIASVMHMRIELRQIYERDDIKLRGALAMCGRPCCCLTHLCDYEKVTVKMAKNQNLSLNPTKVSGMCGKLMCCLKYENDYYVETSKIMPKAGATIVTEKGSGKVDEVDLLKQRVKATIHTEDGSITDYFNLGEFSVAGNPKQQQSRDDDDDNDSIENFEE